MSEIFDLAKRVEALEHEVVRLQDVCDAVDREMQLRARLKEAEGLLRRVFAEHGKRGAPLIYDYFAKHEHKETDPSHEK